MTFRIAELCAGYGGLGMAVQSVLGGEIAWTAEVDEGACKILAHRFPGMPNHGDITAADWPSIEPPDVFCAGFPCQPVSLAGKRLGEADERWIWPAVAGAVRDLRPGLVVLENVSALVVRGLAGVAADLAEIGYVGSWCCLRASDVGAPHRRERVFIVAWPAEDADRAAGRERRLAAPGQTPGGRSRADTGRSDRALAADAEMCGRDDRIQHAGEPGPASQGGAATVNSRGRDLAAADADLAGLQGAESAQRYLMPARSAPADPERDGLEGGRAATWAATGRAPAASIGRRPSDSGPDIDWGIYALAIRRWERILGRPAPRPTEPGRTGERLAPRFVEWMMGLPEGWVTDVLGLSRNAQLKALGNGVVPQQCALALQLLLPAYFAEAGEAA